MIKKIAVIGFASILMLSCVTGFAQTRGHARVRTRHIARTHHVPRIPVYAHHRVPVRHTAIRVHPAVYSPAPAVGVRIGYAPRPVLVPVAYVLPRRPVIAPRVLGPHVPMQRLPRR